ncbi:MAG TPA: class I SAM-dependent RNA methyltransferase [Bacteroidia bacterium]|nr:class I SAM-dependent RNA methyltransferase [Bacteroidia bacterium]
MNPTFRLDQKEDFEIKVTTFFGLEEVLAAELKKLGGRDVQVFKRGVSVLGDMGFLYKINLCLHTALKVLIPITKFRAENEQELYAIIKQIPWEQYISEQNTLMVESVVNSEVFSHSLFISQKVKDAIVDRFREKSGKRPSVDLMLPDLRIYVHIFRNEVSLHFDSSGEPLFKRGYRADKGEAPMKEVLAAGLVKLSTWEPHQLLIDGMSGSGTIAIEAALWAANIPPGYYRNEFGFMRWRAYDEALYHKVYESSIAKISEQNTQIIANELDERMIQKIQANVRRAKVEDAVNVNRQSFFDMIPPRKSGILILNPPYGERIPVKEIEEQAKEIGNKLKKDFKGFTAWIITSNPETIKSIGLKPSRKIQVYNGALDCRFLRYDMYEGSKKASKNPGWSGS